MPLMIEGGPSEEYEQANRDRAILMAETFQALYDRERAEKLWQSGKRDDAIAILEKNPNVGIEYRGLAGGEVVESGSYFGKDAADFLKGINIAVSAGLLSPLTSARAHSHHAGANPQNIRKIDLKKQITLLAGSFDSEDEVKVRNAVEHLLSEKCDDAFQAVGLASPAAIIFNSGIVLGAATLLLNPANNSSSGITEYARTRDLPSVGSTGTQAFTIRNHPGKTPDTTDERARIFLNRSAFAGGVYSLQDVITHEFLHVAGMEGAHVPFYGPLIRRHDLSYVKNYDSIIEACK